MIPLGGMHVADGLVVDSATIGALDFEIDEKLNGGGDYASLGRSEVERLHELLGEWLEGGGS